MYLNMTGLNRFTGASWQIERHYEVNPNAKNCANCTYFQKEGRMCRKKNEHISYSFAKYCKYFKNINNSSINEQVDDFRDNLSKLHNQLKNTSQVGVSRQVEQNIDRFNKPKTINNSIENIILIQTKKRWFKNYVLKEIITIDCRGVKQKVLNEMKNTKYIICYDGVSVYKLRVRLTSYKDSRLVFSIRKISNYFIPDFIELSNSKNKIVVENKFYNSVIFVKERIGGS